MKKYLVTGATGNTGSATIERLLKRKNSEDKIFAGMRNIGKIATDWENKGIETVRFDFLDMESVREAVNGMDAVFFMRPPAISNVKRDLLPFLEELKRQAVGQVVFLSLQGVENNKKVPHYSIEQYMKELNLPYTFLRPSFFMQNMLTAHLEEIRDRDEIFIPAGDGKTNFIDVRDIGETAAIVMVEDGHIRKAYELTGSRPYDYYEIARIFSEELGREIEYQEPSALKFILRKLKEGEKPGFIFIMLFLYGMVKKGNADHTSDIMKNLLGREPISFRQFVKDHKSYWK